MKPNTVFISLLLLASVLLNGCGPITINPPAVEITVVVGADTPAGEEPAPPADQPAPSSDGSGDLASNQTMMMFLYILLALVGVAILFVFIASMRRPDAP